MSEYGDIRPEGPGGDDRSGAEPLGAEQRFQRDSAEPDFAAEDAPSETDPPSFSRDPIGEDENTQNPIEP